eukprot:scaffold108068_cov63-Phaeocystis_antarctica.AAC.2
MPQWYQKEIRGEPPPCAALRTKLPAGKLLSQPVSPVWVECVYVVHTLSIFVLRSSKHCDLCTAI